MDIVKIFDALYFATMKHSTQKRKNKAQSPYINHPIEVAHLLLTVGKIEDTNTIIAALLHDTLEDTQTTSEEIQEKFGADVLDIVQQVTDDKTLPKPERKRLQIVHAPTLRKEAKLVKLGDKISNVQSIFDDPPFFWDNQRRKEYIIWANAVINGLRGTNEALEKMFDTICQKTIE
jgi:guanosine-3',5'-bis(diphosphate) 3'-pyrophosphohydrolase